MTLVNGTNFIVYTRNKAYMYLCVHKVQKHLAYQVLYWGILGNMGEQYRNNYQGMSLYHYVMILTDIWSP